MKTAFPHSDADEMTPILIVGGGLVGLSTSLFLAFHGISSLLVEHHPGTAIHPRAPGMSPRTMEMFRSVGTEDAIRKVEPPPMHGETILAESLLGPLIDVFLKDISEIFSASDAFPVAGSGIAQDTLEPVLRARAEQLGGVLRFGTELLAFEQDAQGITATIRQPDSSTRSVRAQFLVAADGTYSGTRQYLGIGKHGAASLWHCISMIFEADLLKYFRQRNALMCFVTNEELDQGTLTPYPGSSARPDLIRFDIPYDPEEETPADYPESRCLQLIRAATGIPDLVVKFRALLSWEANALVADRFQLGRVFLVGDAARTQPPTGGLGGNTGIAEAYNLAWKLAAVVRGEAGEALLTTYDMERRRIADYGAEQAALLSRQREEGSSEITVDIITINAGFRYNTGAIVQEAGADSLPLAQAPSLWKGEPGTHAPNLLLEREGKPFSTGDLFGSHFVLLAGPQGKHWKDAAQAVQEALHQPNTERQLIKILRLHHAREAALLAFPGSEISSRT